MFPFLAWPGIRRWGRVVRPLFPPLPGSAVWRFLLEKHSWDWQAALVPGLIYACVPPLTDLGSQGEKTWELFQNYIRWPWAIFPALGTQRTGGESQIWISHWWVGPAPVRMKTKAHLHFCFPSQVASCTIWVYSFCFVFPPIPSSALFSLPSQLPICSSAPSCHSKGWHFWKVSRYFSYFYSAWHKVKIWVSWLCSVRFFAASVLPLKNTHLILETPVLTLVLLMRSRKTHSA